MQDAIDRSAHGPSDHGEPLPMDGCCSGIGDAAGVQPSRMPEASAGQRPAPTPPSSKGGCQPRERLLEGVEVSRCVDYLTVSLPTSLAQAVVRPEVRQVGDWTARRFFGRACEHLCPGGSVWWKEDPISPSSRWGTDYTVLEASGAGGAWLADRLAQHRSEINPTRLDLAVDVLCDRSLSPGDVVAPLDVGELKTASGFGIRYRAAGEPQTWPWWVGARQSGRMLRFYRKDLESPLLYPGIGSGVMRVELEVKEGPCKPLYDCWAIHEPSAWGAYGRHVYDMTGREFVPISDLPAVEKKPNVEALQQVIQFIEQHGNTLDAAIAAGIDVVELAAVRAARPVKDKGQKSRQIKRRLDIGRLPEAFGGIEQLQDFLREQIMRATIAKGTP